MTGSRLYGKAPRRPRPQGASSPQKGGVDAGSRRGPVGLAASTLRRIETGEESVQLRTLGKLANLYDVDPCDLLRRMR